MNLRPPQEKPYLLTQDELNQLPKIKERDVKTELINETLLDLYGASYELSIPQIGSTWHVIAKVERTNDIVVYASLRNGIDTKYDRFPISQLEKIEVNGHKVQRKIKDKGRCPE